LINDQSKVAKLNPNPICFKGATIYDDVQDGNDLLKAINSKMAEC